MSRWNLGSDDSPGPTDSSHREFDRPAGGARCRECSTTVTGESKFCPNCGARMQEVCFACGALSAGGAKFCGDCGADLIDGLETQVTLFEERLSEARQLVAESHFDKTTELLLPITAAKHPILARYATEARELIARSRTLKSEKEEEASRAYETAQAAQKRNEYHQALKILDEIGVQFRTEPIEEALGRLRPIATEIDRLSAEIVDRSAKKNAPELLRKVGRLLELQPGHIRARQTAEQFRDYAHRQARERLNQGEHDRAAQILDLVPKAVTTEETQDLCHRAHEFGSLQWDLLHAPAVDATLVDVGRRLREIAPGNQRFRELHEKLTRFTARHSDDSAMPPTRWASPPKKTLLGCPVEWLTGFGDVEIADTVDRAVLDRYAGSFFPAFGLALQGLGKAAIGISFQMNRKSRGLRPSRSAWGLDLSPGGLKALRLDIRKKDQQIVVGACDVVEHRKPLGQATGPDERQQLMTETIEVFRKRVQRKLDRVCVSLPDMQSISRHVKVPPANAQKLAEVMEHEAQVQLSQFSEDLVWDYQPVEPADEASPQRERQVLLVAVRKSTLQMSLDVLQASKLKVDQVQVDWLALTNALIHLGHFQTPESKPNSRESVAVLDVGSETSMVLVQRSGVLDSRPIRVGGYSFTRALAHEFQLSVADAENVKRDPRPLELLSRFDETLRPVLEDLVRDMQTGLTAQSLDDKPLGLRRVFVVGGGMRLHGLWRHLLCGR